jgi:membrane protein YdbS with pleckstrin-like domain
VIGIAAGCTRDLPVSRAIAQSRRKRRLSGRRDRRLLDPLVVSADERSAPCAQATLCYKVNMPEENIWRGSSSQYQNLGLYILCGLFCWLIVPIFFALARYLQTKNRVYELTSERLKVSQGVFSKVTSTVELYRVKDIEVRQPFTYRVLGLENLNVTTSDISSPFLVFDAIPVAAGLPDKLRNQVELIRVQKRVREVDLE